jgi:hypothetical protein
MVVRGMLKAGVMRWGSPVMTVSLEHNGFCFEKELENNGLHLSLSLSLSLSP